MVHRQALNQYHKDSKEYCMANYSPLFIPLCQPMTRVIELRSRTNLLSLTALDPLLFVVDIKSINEVLGLQRELPSHCKSATRRMYLAT
jgi:hypothetical protein